MKKLQILFITKGTFPFPPIKGGAVENLLDILVEKNELYKDFSFTVFSILDNDINKTTLKRYENCNFEYIDSSSLTYKIGRIFMHLLNRNNRKYFGNQYILSVIRRIKKQSILYDAIIIENAPEYAIPLRKISNTKIIQHLHNELVFEGSLYSNQIIQCTDIFLTVSNYISKRVSTVNNKKTLIKVLYNGVELGLFNEIINNERQAELQKKYNINKNDIVIVYTGRLQPHKGVKELFLAFKNIEIKYNVKLLIVGASGYSTTNRTKYIKELEEISKSFKNRVIFTGYIDYSEISDYYKMGDISVLPSLWEDPCPLTCIESLASGLPLIITNSGGMPELVDLNSAFIVNKDHSIITQIEDCLVQLIENLELRESMGRAARLRSQLFSDEKFYQNFKQLINENI